MTGMEEQGEEIWRRELNMTVEKEQMDLMDHSLGTCGDDCQFCKVFGKETRG